MPRAFDGPWQTGSLGHSAVCAAHGHVLQWQQSAQMDPQKLPAMAGQGLPLVLDESLHK